jgi:hypothetical protein
MLIAQQGPPGASAVWVIIGIIILITLLPVAFWIWMIIDCLKNEPAESPETTKWTMLVLLFGPIGAMIYHSTRRKKRLRELGR